jgi:hypothetical protein
VSAPSPYPPRGGGAATTALFAFAMAGLGLLGGLPVYVGPALGAGTVVISALLRALRPDRYRALALAPAVAVLGILAATAPPGASTELFGGLSGLAFLLWVADDPARPSGGGRRSVPTIALAALGVGLAWAVTLALPTNAPNVALGAALLAAALVLLAVLLGRLPRVTVTPFRNA